MNKIIWKEPTIIGIGDVIEDNTAGNKSNMLLQNLHQKLSGNTEDLINWYLLIEILLSTTFN